MKHKYMKYQARFFPALKSLLRWYEKGDNESEVKLCPLCPIAQKVSDVSGVGVCGTCPWVVFTGYSCRPHTYAFEDLGEVGAWRYEHITDLRKKRPLGFAKWRIKNIKNWISQIAEYEAQGE